MPNNLKSVEPIVHKLLEDNPHLRDDDNKLLANIWHFKLGCKGEEMSAFDVLKMIAAKELPHFESIRRCRQKLQELNPRLRGRKWESRQKHQAQWKKDISLF